MYDEPEHAFIHKWLLLTDPYDAAGGSKGYLKISVNVIGPGDEPKVCEQIVSVPLMYISIFVFCV